MKFFLKKQMVTGFFVALVVLSVLGVYAYINMQRLIDTASLLSQASRIVNNAERLLVLTIDIETGIRGYVITGDKSYLVPYENSQDKIEGHIDELMTGTSDRPTQNQRVRRLQELIRERGELAIQVLRKRDEGFEEARALVSSGIGKRKMDEVRALIAEIQDDERLQFRESNTITRGSLVQFQYAFLGLLIIPGVLIVILFYSINRHLNARTIVENDLRRASEEISDLNRELEAYTYSVSHDLRAPLRSISGYSQVIKEDYAGKLDAEGNRVIDVVIRNSKRMGLLIDDLLHFSRVGRKELIVTDCDMDVVVRTTLEELMAHEKGRNIDVHIEPLQPARGDVSMIRQVWMNLIDNALKYSSKNEEAKIEIGSYPEGPDICYYIRDNGVGFNMAYKDKLFGVFQRLHKAHEFEGTGVGLALAKKIVTRHGGRIWAEARLNEGAMFSFSLPAATS